MGRLKVRRLGYALGAEIGGLDLTKNLDDETVAEIRAQWLEHIVLCFPKQDLTPEQLGQFGSRFGQLDDNTPRAALRHPESTNVLVFVNKPTTINTTSYTGFLSNKWHSDFSHTDHPTTASFLNAKELPEVGGDTMWANQYMAYDSLSPKLKGVIESLEGVHDVALTPGWNKGTPEIKAQRRLENPLIAHPLVMVHPETGRKALYAGPMLRNIVGMTEEESRPLLDLLTEHATRYEVVYRHRWAVNDLLMWDNRCALHYAIPDYDLNQLRRLQRCSLQGPKKGSFVETEAREPAAAAAG